MAELVLFEDQAEVLDKVRAAFKEGHHSVMLYAPTGAGKTEMAMSMLKATADNDKRAAMVLDRIILCNQTSARLDKYSIAHGVMQAGHWRWRPYERVQVASAQTLEKRGSFPGLKLLIVDEAHDQRKQTIEFIKNHTKPEDKEKIYVLGLSASPFSDGLAKTYTKVVSATTTAKLVEQGRLVPLKVYICKEVDMEGVKKKAGEWAVDDAAVKAMQITGDVVSEWVKMTTQIFGGPVKTIVFCTNVAHGADLAQKFAEAGYNFVAISYKDSDEFKREAVKDFEKPDTAINGLIACDILTKGFDVPDVKCIVSARPYSKSFKSWVQQMGRGMRAAIGKTFCLLLDHAGNYTRFQEDWDELYHEGVTELKDGKEKTKKELTVEEKKQRKCPACGALWIGAGDVCSSCGFHRPHINLVQTVPGEMEEVKGSVPKETKQQWYSELLHIAHARGYSDGWCAHKYKEKFGGWPRGLEDVTRPPSTEVLKWEQSRRIAWAKGKAKAA